MAGGLFGPAGLVVLRVALLRRQEVGLAPTHHPVVRWTFQV